MSTLNPDDAAAVAQGDYSSTLRRSFSWRYTQGQDVWSAETALHEAAAALFAHLPAGGRLLDIGIGSAANVQPLLAAGHVVTGIDIVTPATWPDLRARWGAQLTLVEADFLEWDATAGAFDMISDLGCLHHQQAGDYCAYLQKIRRLLRAQGRLALCVYEERSADADVGGMQLTDHGRLAKNFTEAELRALLASAAFVVVGLTRIERAPGLPPYLAVLAARAPSAAGSP